MMKLTLIILWIPMINCLICDYQKQDIISITIWVSASNVYTSIKFSVFFFCFFCFLFFFCLDLGSFV